MVKKLILTVIHHTGRELLTPSEDIHSLVEQCVALPIQLAHLTHQVGIDLMEIHVLRLFTWLRLPLSRLGRTDASIVLLSLLHRLPLLYASQEDFGES